MSFKKVMVNDVFRLFKAIKTYKKVWRLYKISYGCHNISYKISNPKFHCCR